MASRGYLYRQKGRDGAPLPTDVVVQVLSRWGADP